VDVASPQAADLAEGGLEQGETDVVPRSAVIGPDDHLDAPGVVSPAELGVTDETAVRTVAGHESGEARSSPVDEVQPLVLAQGTVPVGHRDLVEKFGDLGDVGLAHTPFDLDVVHERGRYRAHPAAGH
jgi:hypothetical protein